MPSDDDALRNLIGSGGTRLPAGEAIRAREVSRPTPEDVARAERELVIRHARPVEEQGPHTAGGKPGRPGKGGKTRSRS